MHEIKSERIPPAEYASVKRVDGYPAIQADYPDYLIDESKLSPSPVDHLFFPKDEAELAAVLTEMGREGRKVTVSGARTGLVGGCVAPEGALVSLERFDRVHDVYHVPWASEWRVRAGAGVRLRDLAEMIAAKSFPALEREAGPEVRENLERFKADPKKYFYPPDPTEMSASIGGTAATNASGARTYRYGPTRAWIRGIRVMLASGEVLDIPRGKYFASPGGEFVVLDSTGRGVTVDIPSHRLPRTKNTAGVFSAPGMDLADLFIGSEGVFGVITTVDVALAEKEDKLSLVQFLDTDAQALALVQALREDKRIRLDFLEFYSAAAIGLLKRRQAEDPKAVGVPAIPEEAGAALFFEFSFDPDDKAPDHRAIVEAVAGVGASIENSWAGYEQRELDRFKEFRHILPETVNAIIAERKKSIPGLHKLGTDLAVPPDKLNELWTIYAGALDQAGLEWLAFGHIGDSHLHLNLLPASLDELNRGLALYRDFARKVVDLGGTVSAEHGVGKLKKDFLKVMFTEEEIGRMVRIKEALDPGGLLNPGDIFGG